MEFLKTNGLNNRWKTFGVLSAVIIMAVSLFVFTPYSTTAAGTRAPIVKMVPQNFTQLAKNCGPAVVNISTVKTLSSGGGRVFEHFFAVPGVGRSRLADFLRIFLEISPSGNSNKAAWAPVLFWIRTVTLSRTTMSSTGRMKFRSS